MAETSEGIPAPLQCSGVIAPRIDEARAREIVREWVESDTKPFIPDDKIGFGKAVMLYYPFWKYSREDGGTDVTIYRPAFGTLLSGLQRDGSETIPVPDDANILPATIYSSVYYPALADQLQSEKFHLHGRGGRGIRHGL